MTCLNETNTKDVSPNTKLTLDLLHHHIGAGIWVILGVLLLIWAQLCWFMLTLGTLYKGSLAVLAYIAALAVEAIVCYALVHTYYKRATTDADRRILRDLEKE